MAHTHSHLKNGQSVPFTVQYAYGLSKAVAMVNGKQVETEWIYRNETATYQAIRKLIDEA